MAEWLLKGAGNANLVFSYHGQDEKMIGLVLRVRKIANWHMGHQHSPGAQAPPDSMPSVQSSTSLEEIDPVAYNIDMAIWEGLLPPLTDGDNSQREEHYVLQYLTRWVNSKYLPRGVPCELPPPVMSQMSAFHDQLDPLVPPQVFPDLTVFSGVPLPGWKAVGTAVCAEIKPKSGCMPPLTYVCADNAQLKSTYPRYVMHALMKAAKGKGSLNAYSPVDLFSQEPGRVRAAVEALLEAPNNNIRLFVGGKQIWGDAADKKSKGKDSDSAGSSAADKMRVLAGLLVEHGFTAVQQDSGVGSMVAALQQVLCTEELLPQLLAVQQQDTLDIEGAEAAYAAVRDVWVTRLIGGSPSPGSRSLRDAPHGVRSFKEAASFKTAVHVPETVPLWNGFNEEQILGLLRGYLTAATAKDCGIMVTMQQVVPDEATTVGDDVTDMTPASRVVSEVAGAQQKVYSLDAAVDRLSGLLARNLGMTEVKCEDGQTRHFMYKITLLDLDVKSSSKIPSHAKLDADIIACANKNIDKLKAWEEARAARG